MQISSQAIPEPSTARLRELDLAHHLPAQQNYHLMQTLGGSRIITRAEGCYIHDADGNKILDGMAGLWCVNVGYGRAELADVARDQMLQLPFYNTFFRTATVPGGAAGDQDRRAHRRQAAARVLQQLGLGGQRHGLPPGAPLLGPARPAQAQDLHQPLERLPRLDGRGREPRRHEAMHAQGDLPIPGHRAHHAALQVRRRLRRERGGVRGAGGRRARAAHPRTRARARGGLHRRAGAGRGRRDHPAARLLAAGRARSAGSTACCWSPTR